VRRAVGAVLAGLALAVAPGAALAAECPKTSVADLEDEVMCPVCGTPLALATEAPQAKAERAQILGLVEQCKSKDEIKAALVEEYGEQVLAVPDEDGFGVAAVLVPGLAVGLGGLGVGAAALYWRRRRPSSGAPDSPSDDAPSLTAAEGERLDADLRRFDA